MYQSNHHPQMANQSLGNYQRLSGMSTGNVSIGQGMSPDKRSNKKTIGVKNYNDVKVGDQIEVFEIVEVKREI